MPKAPEGANGRPDSSSEGQTVVPVTGYRPLQVGLFSSKKLSLFFLELAGLTWLLAGDF